MTITQLKYIPNVSHYNILRKMSFFFICLEVISVVLYNVEKGRFLFILNTDTSQSVQANWLQKDSCNKNSAHHQPDVVYFRNQEKIHRFNITCHSLAANRVMVLHQWQHLYVYESSQLEQIVPLTIYTVSHCIKIFKLTRETAPSMFLFAWINKSVRTVMTRYFKGVRLFRYH